MSISITRPPGDQEAHAPSGPASLTQGTLPRWAPPALLAGALAVAALFLLVLSGDIPLPGLAVLTVAVYAVAVYALARRVEGRRKATDRLVTAVVTTAFALAMVPLVSVLWTVLDNGLNRFDLDFFTMSMRGVVGEGGGAMHAIQGTLIITGLTVLISVPIGIMTAIYLVEYGTGKLAKGITFLVDVMTGIPSIVAGLFAFALFALFAGPGVRMGLGGAVALSVLMIPVVIRSSEEMLKLVPNELREASYALGVPKWLTILRVVIPTAIAGIATGVTIAIARVIGETAPLLVIVGITNAVNNDPLDGRMATLPVYAYYQFTQPGVPPEAGQDRAWTAALVLIIIVMGLNLIARFISHFFAPKTDR